MLGAGKGLTAVRTKDLKKLLALLHREELAFPAGVEELTRCGLQHIVGEIDVLRGLDSAGVRAVLVSVLAERARAARRSGS